MGILKPLKKNEFQTVALKLSKPLHERLRNVQELANEADLEFDVNDLLVPLLEKAVAKAEKELEGISTKTKQESKEQKTNTEKTNAGGGETDKTNTPNLSQTNQTRM